MAAQERKLATILAMDVVGYSSMMNKNEAATVKQLRICQGIIETVSKEKSGRIFNTAGDAFMIEFPTTIGAVETAIEIQEKVASHNKRVSQDERLEFRMGVNIGDVTIEGKNLLGDGVNIAARLEGIAPPAGICISESVHSTVRGKVSCTFIDQGVQNLKNIEEPVRAYYADVQFGTVNPNKFEAASGGSLKNKRGLIWVLAATLVVGTYLLTNNFSDRDATSSEINKILVLPLDTQSVDQTTINLGIGVTQDLVAGLSASTAQLKILALNEKPDDLRALVKEVSARYILSGTLRKSGDNMRISVGLMDAESMETVWSEKYDREFSASNIFALQDEMVNGIIDSLVGNGAVLAQEVAKNVSIKGTTDLSGYECVNFVRGQYFKVLSPDMHASGLKCLRQAVIDDPDYKDAWHLLGHMVAWGYALYAPHYQPISKEGLSEAVEAVEAAIRLNKNFARAYATRAELALYTRSWTEMMRNARKAYELAPNDAYTVGHISYLAAVSGSGCKSSPAIKDKYGIDDKACERLYWGLERAQEANRLDEISTLSFDNYGLAEAYLNTGEWGKALAAMEVVPSPDFHFWNIAMGLSHHHLGNASEARPYLEKAKELHGPDEIKNFSWMWHNIWNREVQLEAWLPVLREYGWE